jgi:hypothetical protein
LGTYIAFVETNLIDFIPPSNVEYDCVFCMMTGSLYTFESLKFLAIISKVIAKGQVYVKDGGKQQIEKLTKKVSEVI